MPLERLGVLVNLIEFILCEVVLLDHEVKSLVGVLKGDHCPEDRIRVYLSLIEYQLEALVCRRVWVRFHPDFVGWSLACVLQSFLPIEEELDAVGLAAILDSTNNHKALRVIEGP